MAEPIPEVRYMGTHLWNGGDAEQCRAWCGVVEPWNVVKVPGQLRARKPRDPNQVQRRFPSQMQPRLPSGWVIDPEEATCVECIAAKAASPAKEGR